MKHLSAALLSIILVFVVYPLWVDYRRSSTPVTDWFEVTELAVPDHPAGSNPVIDFGRIIKTDVTGDWTVEVQKAEAFEFVCGGGGRNYYRVQDKLPDPVDWDWFVWDKGRCDNLKEGRYILEVHWDFCKIGWGCKEYSTRSNVFMVSKKL